MKKRIQIILIALVALLLATWAFAQVANIGTMLSSGDLVYYNKSDGESIFTIKDGSDGLQVHALPLYGQAGNVVIASTTVTITAANSGSVYVYTGQTSGKVTYTLPAAVVGLYYTIVDDVETANKDLWITAGTGDKANSGTAGKSYKCITDSVPQATCLMAVDATDWVVIRQVGTWANDNG